MHFSIASVIVLLGVLDYAYGFSFGRFPCGYLRPGISSFFCEDRYPITWPVSEKGPEKGKTKHKEKLAQACPDWPSRPRECSQRAQMNSTCSVNSECPGKQKCCQDACENHCAGECYDSSVGVNDVGEINNGQIYASSEFNVTTPAANGRLNYTSGSSWCASPRDSTPYLRVDLGSVYIICGVATQGNSQADQWVRTYQIQYSTDGTTWTIYQENGQDRVFEGNYYRNTVVKHMLYQGIQARYVRVLPKAYHDRVCMRLELYGWNKQKKPVIKGKPTVFINKFTDRNVRLTCRARGVNSLRISWYKDWEPLENYLTKKSTDGKKIISQLYIPNAQCKDSGLYRCVAKTKLRHSVKAFTIQMFDHSNAQTC